MKQRRGKLSTAEFDRAVSKFAGSCYLGKPFAARREGLSVWEHIEKAATIKARRFMYTETMSGETDTTAGLAVYRACLQVLAAGLKPIQGALTMTFPLESKESDIRPYMIAATNAAYETGILFSDVCVRRSELTVPEITVSVTGNKLTNSQASQGELTCEKPEGESGNKRNVGNEACIVMIGRAAVEGTIILREKEAEKLEKNYSKQFLDTAKLRESIYPKKVVEAVRDMSLYAVVPGEGGIFGALWELSEQLHLGMKVDLTKIKLDPLTVEICETLDVSPYEMMGGGAVLMVTAVPEAAVAMCAEMGQPATIIGVLNKSNDKLIVNGEETRYLEPFRGDILYKRLQ